MDKRRVEAIIRQTTMERHALDKSLNAMEKENSELYKNCSQLQSQLTQLEQENNTKNSDFSSKRHIQQLESEIQRMTQERRQLEKVLNQREINYEHKERMHSAKILELNNQLELERRRRRTTTFQPSRTVIAPSNETGELSSLKESISTLTHDKFLSHQHRRGSLGRTQKLYESRTIMTQQKAPFRV